ncbi:MAG: hypothetical protein V2J10_08975 [Wenzhouxiangella sp.]|nr:hypothetical protein [Wenzhouxiangella sp.]
MMVSRSISSNEAPVAPEILHSWVRAYAASGDDKEDVRDCKDGPGTTRPASDASAAWRKWHRGICKSRFSDEQLPWYRALERARVEVVAAQELPGVESNLRALPVDGLPLPTDVRALYRRARSSWGLGFEDSTEELAAGGSSGLSTGSARAGSLRRLFGRRLRARPPGSDRVNEVLTAAGRCLKDEALFAQIVLPLVVELAGGAKVGKQNLEPDESHDAERGESESETETEVGFGGEDQPASRSRIGNYTIFRTTWDECEPARVWFRPEDAETLRELNALDRRHIQKLAHELQRRLLVQRMRHWDFELEDGMLDSRKLAALVGERPDHRVFKFERESRVPEACVTLLVDQSGSMRGPAHLLAAQAIDVAVHTLEVCGVAVEVLGYTTRYGADNPVVEQWKGSGSPEHPGRLNALRHVILKSAGQPWRVARRSLGLMLRPDFGHENIDGESLYWAGRRLLARPERRRILIVISDGSPYDEASVQHNPPQFLMKHLSQVIQAIETTPIHLVGIGTGRDVGRYYRHTATVRRGDQIGSILFRTLGESLDPSDR